PPPRHYALLDEAIAAHAGVRPVEQGEGDSVVAAFSRASDAVAAAVSAQRALTEEPWPDGVRLRVRMAIHTGEAQLRDEGNYFGQAVIRCARLRAIGHGGQVLVSEATAALVVDRLPDQVGLLDLGTHRLKDLGRPERVWQLTHPDLTPVLPALRSLDAFRHNLPVQLTPLIGRAREVREVVDRLATDRLITLTGSGGVGKTRMAMAVAAEVVDRCPGGVWLVELAGVADPANVAATALAALGVHEMRGVDPMEHLAAALGDEASLVVLDNCEHLVHACAQVVAALLASQGSVSVLATSREPLEVPGEITWRVPSLPAPPPEVSLAVPTLSQYEAVVLFVDRARRARPSFAVTEDNAPAIAQICHRLDGIPLALELAAARCRQMTVEHIARDLDDRFRLLTGGARTVLPRHQTLAASIDWSHDRLDGPEQVVLRRLGVFVGPFPLEAAEDVVAAPGDIDPVEVFDLLRRLVDKSLVLAEDGAGGESRYRLLETVRAYAFDRAARAGEVAGLRSAHVRFWVGWLEARWPSIFTDEAVDEVESHHANLTAALEWSSDDPAQGLRMLRLVARPWAASGRLAAAMVAVDRLLTDEHADRFPVAWVGAALSAFEVVEVSRGEEAAVAVLQQAEAIAVRQGDEYHAVIARFPYQCARELCLEARDLAGARGDRYVEASAIMEAVDIDVDGDPAAADLDTAERAAVATGSNHLLGLVRRSRALAARDRGDLAVAVEIALGMAEDRSLVVVDSAVAILVTAGLLAADEDALEAASDIAERRLRRIPGTAVLADAAAHSLDLLRGGAPATDPSLGVERSLVFTTGTFRLAAREAIAAGAGQLALAEARTDTRDTPHWQATLAAVEAMVGDDEDRWHEALRLSADHGLRLIAVDALEGVAVAAATSESWTECLRLSGAAERLRDETGYRWRIANEQAARDKALGAAHDQLGAPLAETALAEGRALEWHEAAAYALRARGRRGRPRHGWASLTPTEHKVLDLVAEGLTNPQIGDRLLMSRATVKTHVAHLLAKLGARSRAELAAESARHQPAGRSPTAS
ncbi:MAG TPA: LuxR C-terminal-related transcriptional regulator, partial [Acidimicrobiales bacterium]|nr:LuxR C-terminal-related transcriptional regulator [Acidimicrobiales bacterium]